MVASTCSWVVWLSMMKASVSSLRLVSTEGGEKVQGFRSQGVAQQLSDGTFDFVVKPRIRSQSELIRKLAHGRVSKTKDGAIQLTLKVFCDEGINIGSTLVKEAEEAAEAVVDYQLKR